MHGLTFDLGTVADHVGTHDWILGHDHGRSIALGGGLQVSFSDGLTVARTASHMKDAICVLTLTATLDARLVLVPLFS